MVKLLMRADTHVSFTVPASDPPAKCTFSQVNFYNQNQKSIHG